MRTDHARIAGNVRIASDIWKMDVRSSLAEEVKPGQFMQIQVPGFYLRRPISVCRAENGVVTFVYKTVGEGTMRMTEMKDGEEISLFGPLGTGFPVIDRDPVLIGGGVGIPPLLETACRYRNNGRNVTVILGCADQASVILKEEFEALGCKVIIATMDGSEGIKGTVIDAAEACGIGEDAYVLSCGPLPMLKAVSQRFKEGCVSLEARMACGMGACMGCVVKNKEGESLRVCKDGPVFAIGEVEL